MAADIFPQYPIASANSPEAIGNHLVADHVAWLLTVKQCHGCNTAQGVTL